MIKNIINLNEHRNILIFLTALVIYISALVISNVDNYSPIWNNEYTVIKESSHIRDIIISKYETYKFGFTQIKKSRKYTFSRYYPFTVTTGLLVTIFKDQTIPIMILNLIIFTIIINILLKFFSIFFSFELGFLVTILFSFSLLPYLLCISTSIYLFFLLLLITSVALYLISFLEKKNNIKLTIYFSISAGLIFYMFPNTIIFLPFLILFDLLYSSSFLKSKKQVILHILVYLFALLFILILLNSGYHFLNKNFSINTIKDVYFIIKPFISMHFGFDIQRILYIFFYYIKMTNIVYFLFSIVGIIYLFKSKWFYYLLFKLFLLYMLLIIIFLDLLYIYEITLIAFIPLLFLTATGIKQFFLYFYNKTARKSNIKRIYQSLLIAIALLSLIVNISESNDILNEKIIYQIIKEDKSQSLFSNFTNRTEFFMPKIMVYPYESSLKKFQDLYFQKNIKWLVHYDIKNNDSFSTYKFISDTVLPYKTAKINIDNLEKYSLFPLKKEFDKNSKIKLYNLRLIF